MKEFTWLFWFVLLVVIVTGATIANLISLKIAADQVSEQISVSSSPLLSLLGGLRK
jgi:hypothetical protein